ncbi:MAG: heparinase II/III family protein, partial [bacterium]
MGPGEIVFRFRQHIKKIYENIRYNKTFFPVIKLLSPAHNIFNPDNLETRIDSQTVFIYGKKIDLGQKINWHSDYFTGKEFPKEFSKNIDIANEKYGNVKPVWELNRLYFMPALALRYRKSNKQEDLNLFISITSSWIEDNQYLKGVNWFSNIEVSLRLISWFWSWNILEASKLLEKNKEFKEFVENKWIPSIYLHCKYSAGNRSKYSSANNHLIAEAAGLFIAANLWKYK